MLEVMGKKVLIFFRSKILFVLTYVDPSLIWGYDRAMKFNAEYIFSFFSVIEF